MQNTSDNQQMRKIFHGTLFGKKAKVTLKQDGMTLWWKIL